MAGVLRLAIAGAILVLLARAARVAWRNRSLARAVWRRIRPRHVLGAVALMVLVVTVAGALLVYVPITRYGLGTPLGLTGNAVFAPLEEASLRTGGDGLGGTGPTAGATGAPGDDGGDGGDLARIGLMAGTTVFLGGLLLLFPWLAYVEERTFREGLEDATPLREAWAALRFGLLHLIMLIPLAAALAIAVAGFAYGRIYRRRHRLVAARREEVEGPFGVPVVVAPSPARVRGEAVLEATVWHTTFNSLVVVLVLLGFIAQWAGW
jgi:hypothetical protein